MLENALNDTVSWQTRKWSNETKFQVLAWTTISSKGRNWNQSENITSLLANCVDMLVFGTNWKTRHSVVVQQTSKSSHKMDSGMRQTIGKIDLIHSSHKWLPTILSCAQHGTRP